MTKVIKINFWVSSTTKKGPNVNVKESRSSCSMHEICERLERMLGISNYLLTA